MFREVPGASLAIPTIMPRTSPQQPVTYRDQEDHVWYVAEVARLKVVAPSIDGPNVALVIRFEREGEERFARWIGGEDWRARQALDRPFAESDCVGVDRAPPASSSRRA